MSNHHRHSVPVLINNMILESIDLLIFFSYSVTFLFKNCFFFLSECSDSIEKLFFFSLEFPTASKSYFPSCRSSWTASKCCFSSHRSSRQHKNVILLIIGVSICDAITYSFSQDSLKLIVFAFNNSISTNLVSWFKNNMFIRSNFPTFQSSTVFFVKFNISHARINK